MNNKHQSYTKGNSTKNHRFIIIFLTIVCILTLNVNLVKVTPVEAAANETNPAPSVLLLNQTQSSPIPPTVISRKPAEGQLMELAGTVEVEFNQEMDREASEGAFKLTDKQNKIIPGVFAWSSSLRTLKFTPTDPLQPDATYKVTLGQQTTSAEGVQIEEEISFSITTVSTLQVSQFFPLDGAEDIDINSPITVIFNRPIIPLTVSSHQNTPTDILQITPETSGKGEWISTSVYAFHPEQPLLSNTKYTITVKAGLKDAAGSEASQLPKDTTWTFSTAPPTIKYVMLADKVIDTNDAVSDIPLDPNISIEFSQPMNKESVENALSLTNYTGTKIQLSAIWDKNNTAVLLKTTNPLDLGMFYTLSISDKAQSADGGNIDTALSWTFTTVLPPEIQSTVPENGSTQKTYQSVFEIHFASPMKLDSFEDRIIFSPQLPGEDNYYYNPYQHILFFYGLEPSTTYEVTFKPGMTDIYDNQIETEKIVRFTTASAPPSAWIEIPNDITFLRADGPQSFYVNYTNIQNLELSLYSLTAKQFLYIHDDWAERSNMTPDEENLVWQIKRSEPSTTDKRVQELFELTDEDGNKLPPGYYFLGMNADPIDHKREYLEHRIIVITDANLTFKMSASEALLWLTELDSGKPITGAPVKVYDENLKQVADGTTGKDGSVLLDMDIITNYYANRVAITQGDHVAFANSGWGSGNYEFDSQTWGKLAHPPDHPMIYIYTDRPIYRPGQTVYFKGIARLEDDLNYSLPQIKNLTISIYNYNGENVYQEDLSLTEFGTFDGEFTIDQEAALGSYNITAKFPKTENEYGWIGFSVAEYRRLEFQVDVEAQQSNILVGENMEIETSAEYLSGGAVANAEVNWTIGDSPYIFTPDTDKYRNYNYIDQQKREEIYRYEPINTAEGQDYTDSNGKLELSIPALIHKSGLPQKISFEASITDLAGNLVSSRTDILAHPAQYYVGVRPATYIGSTDNDQTFELVVVDWESNPIEEQSIDVEVFEKRWYSVQEQDAQGYIHWETSFEEIPVEKYEDISTDKDGTAEITFTPDNGGVYVARATIKDPSNNSTSSSAQMWVSDSKYVSWQQSDSRQLEIVADRESYAVGDTAKILIASPFQGEAQALVTVERSRIRDWKVLTLDNNSYTYELPITEDMAPNIFFTALVIKGVDDNNPYPDYVIGITQIKVNTEEKTLNVQVTSNKTTAGPRDTITYDIKTTDADGNPISAEVALSLSDLATLLLKQSNSPPLLDFFYSERGIEVNTVVPILMMIEEYNAKLEAELAAGDAMGSGGGGKGGGPVGVMSVREDFPDTAFWDAHVVTDENGEASVKIILPDNLTTWRMDARAITIDTKVGQTTIDLQTSKPLLIRPQTPRFFVEGDKATLGAVVHNNTKETLTVTISLEAEGLKLIGKAFQEIDISSNSQEYITWEVNVPEGSQRADIVFSAVSEEYSDVTRPTLGTLDNQGIPIYRYEVPETVGTSGILDENESRTEIISLPESLSESEGELNIQLAHSLAASLTDGLDYLKHYPFECVEQTVSRFLPNIITTRALKEANLSDPELEENLKEQVNIALQRLYNYQNYDGGWGWWSNQQSHSLTTAYVILAMIEARDSGYTISDSSLARAVNFLEEEIELLGTTSTLYKQNQYAFALYVLARADQPNVGYTVRLYDQRTKLSLYARAFLAQTLALIDPQDTRLNSLISDFGTSAIMSATGTHWEEDTLDYWNWNTDLRTTAIIMDTLIKIDPENELIPNSVRWLMSSRTSGHWRTTQETAWTLMALTDWIVASSELDADFQYAVGLNSERKLDGWANQDSLKETTTLSVDISDLYLNQPNRLVFARNEGPGTLYYTAHLNVTLPVADLPSLDHGMTLSRSYYTLDDLDQPVTNAQVGDLLWAKLTIVAPHDLHYLIITDPLPAGLEAVDQSLETSPQNIEQEPYDWKSLHMRGWGWWYFRHVEMHDEKVVLSVDNLPAGTYNYSYLVRVGTAGTFQVIPPSGQEFYFPEVYGRGEGSIFTIEP